MPAIKITARSVSSDAFLDVWTPDNASHMDAVVAVRVLAAQANGRAIADERLAIVSGAQWLGLDPATFDVRLTERPPS